ncbi:succinate dehydrogenase cytochrome b558 subunit [Paenactinomyces guangxiensis]|uniref:Succinate dehydrogenase cytochrome b558 subunit n=1 Tax=Paenactinomyces guangxiensis TaxID=1490290 RepID=A0A7W2A8G5_9BACL|nr:succinate dehydrogenase cytochrome b558 subunit [Paenactinomyces guangxiensis]MBA4494615.1 succinate dehydrogenase cytochrome b558 subunit [Paenactinomyces guangxiensis]MBH8591622.1 succinate dehydrogenase cytochrome b558 subunit [Paenactinomyces guangxiensis]
MSTQRSFLNRRLHSLLGVIPVGFFLIEHFYTNYHATEGVQEWIEQVEWIWDLPLLVILEIFFIFLPLMYHAIYGLYVAFQAKNNVGNFSTFRNYMFMLQRVTGVITLVFVVWHVWQTRIQLAIHDYTAAELAQQTSQLMQNPVTLTLYIIGIVSAVFHFSNGMWSFLVSWGVTVGPRSQYVSTWVWGVVFVLLSYFGIHSALAFADPNFVSLAQR